MKLKFVCNALIVGLVLINGSPPSFAKVIGKDTRISIPNDYRQRILRGSGRDHDKRPLRRLEVEEIQISTA